MKCTYRATTECRMTQRTSSYQNCQLCLIGQTADEIGLNTSAIMSMSMNKMEKDNPYEDGEQEW